MNQIAAEDHVVARTADDRVVAGAARQRAWRRNGRTGGRDDWAAAEDHIVAGTTDKILSTPVSPSAASCRGSGANVIGSTGIRSPPKITSLPDPPITVSLPVPPDSVLGRHGRTRGGPDEIAGKDHVVAGTTE